MKIKDHVFVLTGYKYFPDYQAELIRQIEALGGRVEESVTEKTHYLILSRDDTDEWDYSEMAKVDVFMDSENGVMIGMPPEEILLQTLKKEHGS